MMEERNGKADALYVQIMKMAQLALKRTVLGGLSNGCFALYKNLEPSLVKKLTQHQTRCLFDFNYKNQTRAMLWGNCRVMQGIFHGNPLTITKVWSYLLEAFARR